MGYFSRLRNPLGPVLILIDLLFVDIYILLMRPIKLIKIKPFSLTKNEGKLFLVPKSSGPLLAGLPLNS